MLKSLLSAVLILSANTAFSQEFTIDPGHSAITSKVQRFGMVNVVGRFNDVSGTITYDDSDIAKLSAEISIKTNSYSSNNEAGENAVKSPAFLDVANYPEITFKSSRIEQKDQEFIVYGELTIHGVSKEVNFPFTFLKPFKDPTGSTTIAAQGTLVINRQDFGITFSRKLPNGKDLIGNEVAIELNVLAAVQ